jgi:hypothetical protein
MLFLGNLCGVPGGGVGKWSLGFSGISSLGLENLEGRNGLFFAKHGPPPSQR